MRTEIVSVKERKMGFRSRSIGTATALILLAMTLGGCTASANSAVSADGAGFWSGTWHGAIVPFTLIASIFIDVGVYAIHNVGFWYNVGFLTGISWTFGLLGAAGEGEGAGLILLGALGVTFLRGLFDIGILLWVFLTKAS
jgi:hypothetical protein